MGTTQIENRVTAIVENFNKEAFIYDLLMAYGISKTTITRLKRGDFNLSKVKGEVLYKSKMLFKEVKSGTLLNTIDELTKDEDSLKHNPRFVIVTDYKTLLAKDIRTGLALDTPILEIHKHFAFFLPWAGQEKYSQKNENYADRKASYKMAKLYDILVTENPDIYDDGGHNLNIFLSRLLFCFFAEDTDIFPIEGMFTDTLEQHTQNDGNDTHTFLDRLFKVLNTEDNSKEAAHFKEFPYVNGGLFRDSIVSPKFTKGARKIVIDCGDLVWSEINPDIFGSMIQAVVNPAYRSGLGMHYTSVPNIMKVIEPLFLNELKDEFEKAKGNSSKIRKLIYRISKIKIFDPACGSGNFLIIAYKELRRLEIDILSHLDELSAQTSIVFTQIKLSQFYGIELDDFAHEMAILSLWLTEHQMNIEFEDDLYDFGRSKPILPLKEAGHITQGNATRIDWKKVCSIDLVDEVYILGNPPYYGTRNQKKEHKEDMAFVFRGIRNYKSLDYISAWFYKASHYINGFNAKYAFVTTNSICQGDQLNILWSNILGNKEIYFAYQSFKWTNNAKGNAGVTVVIIGLRNISKDDKSIISGKTIKLVQNINAYLIDGPNIQVGRRPNSISNLPKMIKGSIPADGGHLLLEETEYNELVKNEKLRPVIKEFIGAQELIKDIKRWCLYITEDTVEDVIKQNDIAKRLLGVKKMREASTKKATVQLAQTPYKFAEDRYYSKPCLIVPCVTSEERDYIPIGFVKEGPVIYASAQAVYDPEPWLFGVINSNMHMCWVKTVGGRLDSRIRYSSSICYNTFPFPELSQKQREQINLHVFAVLEEREKHPEKTLAQLYDSDKMPKGLKEAHHQLDLAIERCYRLKPFTSNAERLEYLFKEYEKMINKNTLLEKPKRTRKKTV